MLTLGFAADDPYQYSTGRIHLNIIEESDLLQKPHSSGEAGFLFKALAISDLEHFVTGKDDEDNISAILNIFCWLDFIMA